MAGSLQGISERGPESSFDPDENWEAALGYITGCELIAICALLTECIFARAVSRLGGQVVLLVSHAYVDVEDPTGEPLIETELMTDFVESSVPVSLCNFA